MNSWRPRAVFGSRLLSGTLLSGTLLSGAWLSGAALVACGSSESSPSTVPPFGDGSSAVPSDMAPDVGAPNTNGSVPPGTSSDPTPSADPSQPSSSEGMSDGVPIDPGMTGANGSANGDGASNGEGNPTGDGTEGDGTEGDGNTDTPGTNEPTPTTPTQPITIWIAGDSTVANGQTPCPRGWGGVFAPHFNDLVTVTNSAVGGRSVHTWLYEVQTAFDDATGECALNRDANGQPLLQPRWQNMLDNMKAGDYLFIQFGINDGDRTCDRHVGIEAFKTAYAMMAQAAKERGAHPVFLTPVSMVRCTGTTAVGSRGDFVPATIEVGQQLDVPVIDLHQRSIELYQSLGFCPIPGGDVSATTTGPVGDFFCDDHTHFSPSGAVEIADVVVQALTEQNIPLAAYLR